jgi:hypothetical protein
VGLDEGDLMIASVRDAQAIPNAPCGGASGAPAVAGVQAAAHPAVAAAAAALSPAPVPSPPPDPSNQIARAAPRAGDGSLELTLPLVGSGCSAVAGGIWLFVRLTTRRLRP